MASVRAATATTRNVGTATSAQTIDCPALAGALLCTPTITAGRECAPDAGTAYLLLLHLLCRPPHFRLRRRLRRHLHRRPHRPCPVNRPSHPSRPPCRRCPRSSPALCASAHGPRPQTAGRAPTMAPSAGTSAAPRHPRLRRPPCRRPLRRRPHRRTRQPLRPRPRHPCRRHPRRQRHHRAPLPRVLPGRPCQAPPPVPSPRRLRLHHLRLLATRALKHRAHRHTRAPLTTAAASSRPRPPSAAPQRARCA